MKIILGTLAAIAVSFATLPAFADATPHNCDTTPPPSGYNIQKQGDGEWKRCYMDSAIGECEIGHTIVPVTCVPSILKAGMAEQYYANKYQADCQQEFAMNYLPAGVSAADCVQDWKCYVTGQCH